MRQANFIAAITLTPTVRARIQAHYDEAKREYEALRDARAGMSTDDATNWETSKAEARAYNASKREEATASRADFNGIAINKVQLRLHGDVVRAVKNEKPIGDLAFGDNVSLDFGQGEYMDGIAVVNKVGPVRIKGAKGNGKSGRAKRISLSIQTEAGQVTSASLHLFYETAPVTDEVAAETKAA